MKKGDGKEIPPGANKSRLCVGRNLTLIKEQHLKPNGHSNAHAAAAVSTNRNAELAKFGQSGRCQLLRLPKSQNGGVVYS